MRNIIDTVRQLNSLNADFDMLLKIKMIVVNLVVQKKKKIKNVLKKTLMLTINGNNKLKHVLMLLMN